jgi:hypothetical protein
LAIIDDAPRVACVGAIAVHLPVTDSFTRGSKALDFNEFRFVPIIACLRCEPPHVCINAVSQALVSTPCF